MTRVFSKVGQLKTTTAVGSKSQVILDQPIAVQHLSSSATINLNDITGDLVDVTDIVDDILEIKIEDDQHNVVKHELSDDSVGGNDILHKMPFKLIIKN